MTNGPDTVSILKISFKKFGRNHDWAAASRCQAQESWDTCQEPETPCTENSGESSHLSQRFN